MTMLAPGDTVLCEQGDDTLRIEKLLGSGAQGEVYEATCGDGKRVAFKQSFPHPAVKAAITNVRRLMAQSCQARNIAYPLGIYQSRKKALPPGFSMMVCPDGYVGMNDVYNGSVTLPLRTRMLACLSLTRGLHYLHSDGLVHTDLSDANYKLHPVTGEAFFFEPENFVANNSPSLVLGTLPFLARELSPTAKYRVDGPNQETDLYALAVNVFLMLTGEHPLSGSRMDKQIPIRSAEALSKWHLKEGVYAFDEKARKPNPPDEVRHAGMIANYKVLPAKLKELLLRSFTEGLNNPDARVRESEWEALLSRLPDRLYACPTDGCRAENFYEPSQSKQVCWACGQSIQPQGFVVLSNKTAVCLSPRLELFAHHLHPRTHRYCFQKPLGSVVSSPKSRGYGLRNDSDQAWTAIHPSREAARIAPGKAVAIRPGLRLHFGAVSAEIRPNACSAN